mmetsp:Transcript_127361/g.179757  ORF Transcript_127361/g.179757 Transcript_127361/m.179757 type:complete len:255 (+) Transcript_127361:73-837(+)
MKIIEYRIAMPMKCADFRVGQLYSVAKMSNQETSGDAGIEVITNEPFEKDGLSGQYTFKIFHLGSRLPGWLSAIAPANALKVEEKAWNAFPYCKTEYTNPMLGERFTYTVESRHFDNDKGEQDNVHNLDAKLLKQRVVEHIDIVDPVDESPNPTEFHSEKGDVGPLEKGWQDKEETVMCAYKLISVEFKYWGFQNKVENFILSFQTGVLAKFHRKLFCWMDEWHGMSIDDIRAYEDKLAMEMKMKLEENESKKK